ENDQEDEQQEQAEEKVMSKKVVEKLAYSKKAKQVAVESELIPVDNDAPVSADEEEAETVQRNKKKINDAPNKVIKKVAGDGSELVLVDNEKEGCKYDPIKINTRMSPVHLKNVLNTCTLPQIMDLNEMGLGHFHSNFNFESTPGELGMWVVKSYDPETHTLRMGDGRRIKVSRELIHEILGVPMGENKVISLPTNVRLSNVGFLVLFLLPFLVQGNKDGTVNQRFIPTLRNIDEFQNYDWCQFILDCIKAEVMEFKLRSYFAGPLFLLTLIYVSSTVSPTTTVERKAPIFKAWSTKLLKKRESEELKSGGFGKLPILEYLEFIEPKKPKLKKKKSKVLLLGSMSREQELEEFKTKTAKEMNKEKDVEKVVHQDLDMPEDIEKEGEFGNNEVEKNTKDLIKGAGVCVEISKKEVSKGVLAIYEEPLKDSESQTSIFDNQPEDSQ
ncbi:hypothetical protein Tco_0024125, partial [Tanacetum coccineum]